MVLQSLNGIYWLTVTVGVLPWVMAHFNWAHVTLPDPCYLVTHACTQCDAGTPQRLG